MYAPLPLLVCPQPRLLEPSSAFTPVLSSRPPRQLRRPPSAQSPFAQLGCYLRWGDVHHLLGEHYLSVVCRSYGLMRRSRWALSFPAPATSNAGCGFPALRSPICFMSRLMRPILLGRLSALPTPSFPAEALSLLGKRTYRPRNSQDAPRPISPRKNWPQRRSIG